MKPSEVAVGMRAYLPVKIVQVMGQDSAAESQWTAEVRLPDGQRVQTNTRNLEPAGVDPDADGKDEGGPDGTKKAFSKPPARKRDRK